MDRLFGKELSNLIDNAHHSKFQQRQLPRLSCKSTRVDDQAKNAHKRVNRSTLSQNQSMRVTKPSEKISEALDCGK